MADAILFDHYTLPKKGTVALSINWSFTIDVTADEARQKVDGWLLDEVSTMIGAGEPLLVIDGTTAVWRVPAIFTTPQFGEVGIAGTVDVHVQTGELRHAETAKAVILQQAQALTQKIPAYQPKTKMPLSHVPHSLQPTHTSPQGDPRQLLATIQ